MVHKRVMSFLFGLVSWLLEQVSGAYETIPSSVAKHCCFFRIYHVILVEIKSKLKP